MNKEEQQTLILESASFTFSQDGNCVDNTDVETLEIRCESSLGIDRDDGCFYVLKTESWSIDSTDDLQKLFDRIQKAIKL
jgi:hypothetical protein